MNAKEPPAFKWKLAGYVDGLTVTLLKSADLEEVEAQLERLKAEGYYRDLTIYPIEAKVPPDPLAAKHAEEKKTTRPSAAGRKPKASIKEKEAKSKPASSKAASDKKAAKPTARKALGEKTTSKKITAKQTPSATSKGGGKTRESKKKGPSAG